MRFYFVAAVWGEAFHDLFVNVCLPSLLSPGNLPTFPFRRDSVFDIYTDARSRPFIEGSEAYAALSSLMATRILLVDDYACADPFETVQVCHRKAILEASHEDAALCFITADTIWSDGSFYNLGRRAEGGVRAVMIPGMRVTRESFVPAVEAVRRAGGGTISLSGRGLAALALRHLHPITQSFFWSARPLNGWSAHLYWWVEPGGVLAHCFHMHPLMIYPEVQENGFADSIDGEYIATACRTPGAIYVVQDSDEILAFEISPLLHCVGIFDGWQPNSLRVARFASRYANAQHRQFVRTPLRIHAGDLSPRWEALERATGRRIDRILRMARWLERVA
jgi:hypothetical protein